LSLDRLLALCRWRSTAHPAIAPLIHRSLSSIRGRTGNGAARIQARPYTRASENRLLQRDIANDGMAVPIDPLIDDAGLRVKLGRIARSEVESRFTMERMTRAYEKVYLDILR
jgi:hypothetical protein